MHKRPSVAIVNYFLTEQNPSGSVDLELIRQLSDDVDFSVFACQVDPLMPAGVRQHRVMAFHRPLAALYWSFLISSSLSYFWQRMRGRNFDVVVAPESNTLVSNLSYAHFCHRAYLRSSWRTLVRPDLRRLARFIDHASHALLERWTWQRSSGVVAVSEGVRADLIAEGCRARITVIENPVRVAPKQSDRSITRGERVQLAFVALGAWERKGLPAILDALRAADLAGAIELHVFGGTPQTIRQYASRFRDVSIQFHGTVSDLPRRLAECDALISASDYEAFPLGVLQAAATGLAIITTEVNGVRSFLTDDNAFFISDRSPDGIRAALRRFLATRPEVLQSMCGDAARRASTYGPGRFGRKWRDLLEMLSPSGLS